MKSFQAGVVPACPENEHHLLVIGGDGGRVQTREKDPETGSRWKEDKMLTITSYFQRHRDHMDYPKYRAKGWPIGSGITASGVKCFGKRVKGTEQFWNVQGAEAILALPSLWLSVDERSTYYWLGQTAKARAA